MASVDCLVDELRDAARELDALVSRSGLVGRFTSTCRSHTEQERLYRAFVSGRTRFPVAPPYHSAHEYGEAFDYVVSPVEYQVDVGRTWESWGGVWGGAGDYVHFELPGASARAGQSGENFIQELAQKYVDLPWWVTLPLPTFLTAVKSEGTFQERAKGSLGSKAMCYFGFSSFC